MDPGGKGSLPTATLGRLGRWVPVIYPAWSPARRQIELSRWGPDSHLGWPLGSLRLTARAPAHRSRHGTPAGAGVLAGLGRGRGGFKAIWCWERMMMTPAWDHDAWKIWKATGRVSWSCTFFFFSPRAAFRQMERQRRSRTPVHLT